MDEEQDGGYEDQGGRGGMNSSNNDQGGGGGGGGGGGSKKKSACVGDCIRKPKAPMIGVKDILSTRFGTMLFAEVLGTFFLVFMGCGSVKAYGGKSALIAGPPSKSNDDTTTMPPTTTTVDSFNGSMGNSSGSSSSGDFAKMGTVPFEAGQQAVMIAFAFGITVACIAQAIGHVSGAHLNPAVSFGLVISGQCSLLQAICYTFAQILGAILGSALLYMTTCTCYDAKTRESHAREPCNLAVSLPAVPPMNALIIEIFLTFLLVLVICGVCDDLRKDIKGSAPLAIGLTVFVCHVTGMQYSGSSVNPARSIGPLLFPSDDKDDGVSHIWIYILGPLIGGLEAGLTYHLFFREKEPDSRSVAPA